MQCLVGMVLDRVTIFMYSTFEYMRYTFRILHSRQPGIDFTPFPYLLFFGEHLPRPRDGRAVVARTARSSLLGAAALVLPVV